MTPKELQIAVAEAMGYRVEHDVTHDYPFILVAPNGDKHYPRWLTEKGAWSHGLPDYPNDLNAMHAIEMSLTNEQYQTWHSKLVILRNVQCMPVCKCVSATAEQRCIAYLKTIGKWKEPNL